jgi:hypothetical protein
MLDEENGQADRLASPKLVAGERRLVALTGASWNRVDEWLAG